MEHHGDRRNGGGGGHEAALRAVQRPAGKPWRGGGGSAAPPAAPPKVYRVEPRDFRELVQRLTGAAGTAVGARQAPAPAQRVVVAVQYGQRREDAAAAAAVAEAQFDYASWLSVPLLSPASSMPAGFDGRHGNGALL